MQLPPGEILIEQLGKLLGHDAGKLLRIGDGDGPAIVAGNVMADADGKQLNRRSRLDLIDHLAKMPLQI